MKRPTEPCPLRLGGESPLRDHPTPRRLMASTVGSNAAGAAETTKKSYFLPLQVACGDSRIAPPTFKQIIQSKLLHRRVKLNVGGVRYLGHFLYLPQQDGAASESSSSREGIVRRFSCQDIRH